MKMAYTYNNATVKPWKIYMRAESVNITPELYSHLDFQFEFSYFVPPDTLPKFKSPPKLNHEVTADFDLKYNLESAEPFYEYTSPKLQHP